MFEDDGNIPLNLRHVPDAPFAVVLVNSEPVTVAQTDLYRRAADTWETLKETERHTWEHYVVIGEAMVAARTEIMRKLCRNDPTGRAYQCGFKAWLVEYGLADMDKGARARLIELIDALPEVNEMLSSWSDQDRRKRNHPNTIYRALEKWRIANGHPRDARTKKPTGTSHNEILQEKERPSSQISEIETARESESETGSATTSTTPLEPTGVTIESKRKKMTPSAARRMAERAERKRRKGLENTLFAISCFCEYPESMELPSTLTEAERDDAVAKLEATTSDLNKLIGKLKEAPIRK